MGWLAVDKDGAEYIYNNRPHRDEINGEWNFLTTNSSVTFIRIPKGSIEKMTGERLTWENEPLQLKVKE